MTTFVDNYLGDLGPDDADITNHDTYTSGVPHATFDRIRSEDPIHWVEEEDGSGFWAITRHADALTISRDTKTFSSAQGIRLEEMAPDELEARRTMMEFDAPEHTRLRRLVNRGFTRRSVAAYEEAIRELAIEVVERALESSEFDFVQEVARELPMRMLSRLLGTTDEEGRKMVAVGDALIGNADSEFTDYPVDLVDTEEFRLMPFRSPVSAELYELAGQKAQERRECPMDDVITKLIQPTSDGTLLTDLEFNNFFTLLVAAGNDTTRYTMSHGLRTMAMHPQLWQAWKADPSLTETAVEEILRTSAVTMHFRRTVTVDVEIGGKQMKAGDKVLLWFNAANHDPEVFENPWRFDLGRQVNPHMAFGLNSPHLCLGADLARMEIKVLFEELLKRVEKFELIGEPEYLRSNFIAGIKHLQIGVS